MTDEPKYYRTKFTFFVLSEGSPVNDMDLADLARECDQGDCVGSTLHAEVEEITGREAAAALYEVGSEPGFFNLDDNGEPVDDDDDDDDDDRSTVLNDLR
jgi:hypothetical protein